MVSGYVRVGSGDPMARKGHGLTFWVIVIFSRLIWVVATWVHSFVKTYKTVHKILLYINYTSVKQKLISKFYQDVKQLSKLSENLEVTSILTILLT